jgi:hypothetical protein
VIWAILGWFGVYLVVGVVVVALWLFVTAKNLGGRGDDVYLESADLVKLTDADWHNDGFVLAFVIGWPILLVVSIIGALIKSAWRLPIWIARTIWMRVHRTQVTVAKLDKGAR